jgi:hypothetical protein
MVCGISYTIPVAFANVFLQTTYKNKSSDFIADIGYNVHQLTGNLSLLYVSLSWGGEANKIYTDYFIYIISLPLIPDILTLGQ